MSFQTVTQTLTDSLKVDVLFCCFVARIVADEAASPVLIDVAGSPAASRTDPLAASQEPFPSLASAKGHGTLYLCPCRGPHLYSTYLIRGQA